MAYLSPIRSAASVSNALTPRQEQSPAKLLEWNVRVLSDGTINPSPPTPLKEMAKNVTKGVYRFKHRGSGRRYYGSFYRGLGKRMSQYRWKLNAKNNRIKRYIVNAIKRSPGKFSCALVGQYPKFKERTLLNQEAAWQDRFDSRNRKRGYNQSDPRNEPLRAGKKRKSSYSLSQRPETPAGAIRNAPRAAKEQAKENIAKQLNFEALELE